MRTIKFRAWIKPEDGETGRMVFPVWTGLPIDEGHEFQWEDEFGNRNDYGCDDAIWMQFTGLTDKNGIEIFENDVVRVYGELRRVTFENAFWTQLDLGGFGTQVIEENGSHYFKPLYRYGKGIEVIGNIWEHPDLITP